MEKGNSENLEGEIILRHREPREREIRRNNLWRETRRTEHGEGDKFGRNRTPGRKFGEIELGERIRKTG